MRTVDFIPPLQGLEGYFNTFRLGGFYFKHLSAGETVALCDSKAKLIFGRAIVEAVVQGPLSQMLTEHAHMNHTQLANDEAVNASESLMLVIRRLYGPHIATESKKTTVIYLRRIDEQKADEP